MAFSYPYFLTLQIYENIISFLMNYYTRRYWRGLFHLISDRNYYKRMNGDEGGGGGGGSSSGRVGTNQSGNGVPKDATNVNNNEPEVKNYAYYRNEETKEYIRKANASNTDNYYDSEGNKWIYYGNSQPPDFDGYLTLDEANDWYRNGDGKDLYVDLSKISFGNITANDFEDGIGSSKSISILNNTDFTLKSINDGLVYGSLTLTLITKSYVSCSYDEYDFRMHSGNSIGTWARNIQTNIAQYIAGNGKSYFIYFYGFGKLK